MGAEDVRRYLIRVLLDQRILLFGARHIPGPPPPPVIRKPPKCPKCEKRCMEGGAPAGVLLQSPPHPSELAEAP